MDGLPPNELQQQLAALNDRVERIERLFDTLVHELRPQQGSPAAAALEDVAVAAVPAESPGSAAPPSSGVPGHASRTAPVRPLPVPDFSIKAEKRATSTVSTDASERANLENRIGSHLFNRVGIFAVLVGMAWFLKFAFDNHWVGPLGRVIIGLATGGGLIVWSERFRARGHAAFSYSLKAVGSGVLYLSLWAAYDVYHLIPPGVAFFAMILVTAWNGYMAWAQDAELLAAYALAGGIGTPLLVSTGENHQLVLFGYVLALDIAMLLLVARRPWPRLVFGSFMGTVLLLSGWAMTFYTDQQFTITAVFVAVFFVVFALAPRYLPPPIDPKSRQMVWDRLVEVVLPLANAGISFVALYVMLFAPGRMWAHPWLAVLFAAFYLLMLQFPWARRFDERSGVLVSLYFAMVVVFLTIAIPLQAHGYTLAIGWLVEGAALMWVARRSRMTLLRVLAVGALVLGMGALIDVSGDMVESIVFNARFGSYLIAIASFATVAWFAYGASRETAAASSGTPTVSEFGSYTQWRYIAGASIIVINGLILTAVGLEIRTFWWMPGWTDPVYEQFSYSVWSMLFGGALLTLGFLKRSAFLRWQALFLIVLSIGKVFLLDSASLSQGYRILSFLGLGALLLAVSFFYQRDWLGLRTTAANQDAGSSPK